MFALAAYGLGDLLGAGIYALVGKVAGESGVWAPLSFIVALVVASFTGPSDVELTTRYPKSGGEAFFSERAFGSKRVVFVVGWLVLCSGRSSDG